MRNMESCQERREAVAAHVMGELRGPEADELDAHLAACEGCRRLCDELAKEEAELRSTFDAIARSVAPMKGLGAAQSSRRPRSGRVAVIAAAALAVAAAVVIAVYVGQGRGPAKPVAQVAKVESESRERTHGGSKSTATTTTSDLGVIPTIGAEKGVAGAPLVYKVRLTAARDERRESRVVFDATVLRVLKGDAGAKGSKVLLVYRYGRGETSAMFLGAPQLGLMYRDAESKTPVCIVTLAPADPAADEHGTPMLNGFPGPDICGVRVSAADAPDPDAKVPADAVAALKRELLSSLSDPDARVRVSAISALREWEGLPLLGGIEARVASKLWGDAAARAAILRAAGDSDYHVRWTAVWTIFEQGGPDEEVGRVVSRTLFDPDPMVRQVSRFCVGKLGMKDLLPPPEEVTDYPLEELLSGWSIESGKYGPGDKRSLLWSLKAVKDAPASSRAEAAWLLGEFHFADAAGVLMEALSDDAPEVRRGAAHALGTLEAKDAIGALTGLANDPDGRVRVMAAWALAKLGEQSGFAKLTALLSDPEPRTAAQAAKMLGVLGKEETVPMLLEALRDKRPAVGGAAVMALRPFLAGPKGDAVRAALKQLAADSPSPYVRQAAAVVMQAAK